MEDESQSTAFKGGQAMMESITNISQLITPNKT